MRCSAWSLRSISACSTALLALVAAPAAAAAPPTIDPSTVEVGQPVDVVFSVPNQDDLYGIQHVTLGIPSDFALVDAEAKTGWTQSRTQQAVSWSGGTIPRGEFATFSIRGTAPAKPENVVFSVVVGDRMGKSSTYQVPLAVVPHRTAASGGHTLAEAALIVAIVAGALALGGTLVGLWLWFRPRGGDPDVPEM